MKATEVTEGVYRLSANAENILFEGLWPIPNGVAMNSYIVRGEKVAIIDGVCGWDGVPETLYAQLSALSIDIDAIDYVVINHLEPDHTGWIESFKKMRPHFSVYVCHKGAELLNAFYGLDVDVHPVKSGDTLDLGNGRVLQFEEIPNVHWPETMATFDHKSGTLFSCDAFGSFGALHDHPYDDALTESEIAFFESEAVRYYSNIVAAFSMPVLKAIAKCESLPITTIAPGHGIVWRKDPARIINWYKKLAAFSRGVAQAEVTVIWGSMYGMTEQGIAPVVAGLELAGVAVHVHRVPETPIGDILTSIWTSTGVVLAMPTYEYKMFPPMAQVLDELAKKRVVNRQAFRFGSFGWSGGAQAELDEIQSRLKMNWQFLEPVEFRGAPSAADLDRIRARGAELGSRVVQLVAEAADKAG